VRPGFSKAAIEDAGGKFRYPFRSQPMDLHSNGNYTVEERVRRSPLLGLRDLCGTDRVLESSPPLSC
jgi:hypothetical protein